MSKEEHTTTITCASELFHVPDPHGPDHSKDDDRYGVMVLGDHNILASLTPSERPAQTLASLAPDQHHAPNQRFFWVEKKYTTEVTHWQSRNCRVNLRDHGPTA